MLNTTNNNDTIDTINTTNNNTSTNDNNSNAQDSNSQTTKGSPHTSSGFLVARTFLRKLALHLCGALGAMSSYNQ